MPPTFLVRRRRLPDSKCCRLAPRVPERRATEPSCLEDDRKAGASRTALPFPRWRLPERTELVTCGDFPADGRQGEYERWQKRDLSARRYVYVWPDGVFLQARMGDHGECMLVLIGAMPAGKKELIGFQVGVRESAQSWRELLVEVKSRGLTIAPEIAVGDGALGFWKALDEVFPGTRHQRCWVHKTANVLNKVTLSVQTNMKKDLREIYLAPRHQRPGGVSKARISCRRSSQVSNSKTASRSSRCRQTTPPDRLVT